ncbi:uncharacterized protein LOC143546373 [Bidens hawaiensis]|uniref:uncharacterized protein LOC143546373 n=1 Tax=Bidens hawaiensis TaxID=980011 RepID=UPI004048F33D
MGRAKAVGLDNIPIEVWKCLGEEEVMWLTTLFNTILKTEKMPDQWRSSVVVPIYKNKGDAQCCGNYRGIKLLSHTMKLWERVIDVRLRRETQVKMNQFGFMPGRSTTEAIHILRRLMEKYRDKKLVLDELSKLIKDTVPWCMLFADDIVLIAESKQDLNMRLEDWRSALESKGLKISRSKTEYLYCGFGGVNDDEDVQIAIKGQEVPQSTKFKYLGSFVQSDGTIDSDVAHRVQARWCKWRAATGVLCDKRFPTKLKVKFYRVAIRLAMLYGTDCWAIKKTHMRKLEVAEMRMLR